jgi:hypothetical protein
VTCTSCASVFHACSIRGEENGSRITRKLCVAQKSY